MKKEIAFSLLEISNYGWFGISIFTFETSEDIYPLIHIEYTDNTFKTTLFFGLIKLAI